MAEEDKWTKLREVMREEIDAGNERLLAAIGKNKTKLEFNNGRWVGVTEQQMLAWREAYGAVDIEGELKKAAAWIVSNPHLAPRTQLGRFLNTWFAKTQNTASLRSIPGGKVDPGPGKKLCVYCEKVATGMVSGIWYCPSHSRDAMDGVPVPHMRGVVAKAVAGE